MKILAWNCQGLGNSLTRKQLLQLNKRYSPTVLFVFDTRIKGDAVVDKLRSALHMDYVHIQDPQGLSGGLLLFWKSSIQLSVSFVSRHIIAADITDISSSSQWTLLALYAPPHASFKRDFWCSLRQRMLTSNTKTLLLGDFNATLQLNEKQGGKLQTVHDLRDFQTFVTQHQLVDLGFMGAQYTWNIKARLDRALSTEEWLQSFPNTSVQHLPMIQSDHCPLLLDLCPSVTSKVSSFHFTQAMADDPASAGLIAQAWHTNVQGSHLYCIMEKLRLCRIKLHTCISEGWISVSFASDCQVLILHLTQHSDDKDIHVLLCDLASMQNNFISCTFRFIHRSENTIAHAIASHCLRHRLVGTWRERFPDWLEPILHRTL